MIMLGTRLVAGTCSKGLSPHSIKRTTATFIFCSSL